RGPISSTAAMTGPARCSSTRAAILARRPPRARTSSGSCAATSPPSRRTPPTSRPPGISRPPARSPAGAPSGERPICVRMGTARHETTGEQADGADPIRLLVLAPFPPRLDAAHGGARVIAQLVAHLGERIRITVLYLR